MKWACVFIFLAASCQAPAALSQTPDSSRDDIKRLIVRIKSTFPGKEEYGAGIVFGVQNDQIYIVTANHVVRDGETAAQRVEIQFRAHEEWLTSQLETHYDLDHDLGVVVVANAKAHGIDGNFFPFDRVGDPDSLAQGDRVFLAGHPQGVPWSVTVTPDSFIEPDGDFLRFESKSLFRGHSGGALLNFRLEIIGMLRSDENPNGDALNILKVMAQLKAWGYQVLLRQRFEAAKLETLSAGGAHTCYVNPHGAASCWGGNDDGQLGLGTATDAAQPSAVRGKYVFVAVSAGFGHTCAVTSSAQALCWGDNSSGQLGISPKPSDGLGPEGERSGVPTAVYGGLSFGVISAGRDHTCGLTTRGQAYCWGGNEYGQLGTGDKKSRFVPAAVVGGHTFSSLRAGILFSCGIDQNGGLFCWGVNSSGQLGDGSLIQKLSPVPVASSLKFTALSVGDGHGCAIAADGKAYCWGSNEFGQLGSPEGKLSAAPKAVSGGLTFTTVTAGRGVTYALTQSGAAYSWGDSVLEGLSITDDQVASGSAPAHIFGTRSLAFRALSMTFAHACGLTAGGDIYCWGYNTRGQLGNGSKEDTVRPTLVSPVP